MSACFCPHDTCDKCSHASVQTDHCRKCILASIDRQTTRKRAHTQDELRAPSLEELAEVVARIPNDERFHDRDDYVRVGHAIKAAGADDEGAALAVWQEWCSRWTDGANDPEDVDGDWEGFGKRGFDIGWGYLADMADRVDPPKATDEFDADPAAGAQDKRLAALLSRVTTLSNVTRKRIKWVWKGFIARNELNLLYGDGGVGKSTLYAWLAANVSTGEIGGKPGDVLIITAEDDLESVLEPRIVAAGGDTARIHCVHLEGTFPHCTRDVMTYVRHFNASLVIIDPVSSYMGKANTFVDSEVREALSPLQNAIRDTGTAVLILLHLNKGESGSDTRRINGSVAYRNMSRSAIGITLDPEEGSEARVVFQSKRNLPGKAPKALRLRSHFVKLDYPDDEDPYDDDIPQGADAIASMEPCDLTPEQCLAGKYSKNGDEPTAFDRALAVMQQLAAVYAEAGEKTVLVEELHKSARSAGLTTAYEKKMVAKAIGMAFGATKPSGVGEPWIAEVPGVGDSAVDEFAATATLDAWAED